ncbi:hypothetical protein EJ04DRAFT_592263 [Polyplosphaeria fusca]|uniref:Beta-glucuronidase C-terminal domain-containing protein n=1 Tax=Polyplosphaeria fusca TaxID=682080 RepID=A0A9P4QKU2_9PLEO|nr:hypothetical protein EJ04DRAFT_592263 [Polyplosphaeria fusca]
MKSSELSISFSALVPYAFAQSKNVTLNPAPAPGSGASRAVNHNFPSLAWEKSSFAEYSGNGTHPNLFSDALVNVLQEKVGTPLIIRIGGTSADQDHFNASQTVPLVKPTPPIPNKGLWGYSIGPSYFESLVNFNNSKFIWMLPMAHANDLHMSQDALHQSKLAVNKLGNKLEMLELGNEPNLYIPQKMRDNGYDPARYVAEALQHQKDFQGNVSSLPANTKYQALAYASNVDRTIWTTQKAFAANLNRNSNIHSVSWHYYQAVSGTGVTLQNTLMNHTHTTSSLNRFAAEIRWLHAHNPSLAFVLGEVGSVIAPELKWSVQATFGNALWTVDAMLYAMSINVTRMHMQSGTGFGYAPWNGTDVRPAFYALAMVGDFVGNSTEKELKVRHLDGGGERVGAYAAYEGGVLERAVVVNMGFYDGGGRRGGRGFEIKVPDGVGSVRVRRLMGPGATATGGTSWGGVVWKKSAKGVVEDHVQGGTEVIKVVRNKVQVEVKDSEAVLLQLLR